MKTTILPLLSLTLFFAGNLVHADPMINAGSLGFICGEADPNFLDDEINNAARQAAYVCLAMSTPGVSPGSILDYCAGARNDEHPSETEPHTEAGVSRMRRMTHTDLEPHSEISKAIAQELARNRGKETYSKIRSEMLARLQRDLMNGSGVCADVALFERSETLRHYKWPNTTPAPNPNALDDCRNTLKELRLRHTAKSLAAEDEALIPSFETTQRFVDRVRGLTLHEDINHLNDIDLHFMAKQVFETLDKRIKFLVDHKKPSDRRLAEFGKNDPDFANRIACHFKMTIELAISPRINPNSPTETFKESLLEQFVRPNIRPSRFSMGGTRYINLPDLEELSYLIGSSQFQRAIWLFEECTDSQSMREFFETAIKGKNFLRTEVAISRNRGLGKNESYMVTLPNSIKGIFKPFVQTNRNPRNRENFRGEIAVHEIDKILKLRVVPVSSTLFIDGREGSFQMFVTQALTPASSDLSRAIQMGEGIAKKPWSINLLDSIALNPDRQNNIGNIMVVVQGGKKVAIDNGLAFTAKKDFLTLELMFSKPESSWFIPQDTHERELLGKRLNKLLKRYKDKDFILHDDTRLNGCAKLTSKAVTQTFQEMLAKCNEASDKECNALGETQYKALINEASFLREYNALKCGT